MVLDMRQAVAEMNKMLEQVKSRIAEQGWTVIAHERRDVFQHYSYTVGLVEKGLPELIMVGLEDETSRQALNRLAVRLIAGEAFSDDARIDEILPGYPVAVREVPATVAMSLLRLAHAFAQNRPWKALQVFWPDPSGLFPWDEGYDRRWLRLQPVLGSESATSAPTLH